MIRCELCKKDSLYFDSMGYARCNNRDCFRKVKEMEKKHQGKDFSDVILDKEGYVISIGESK